MQTDISTDVKIRSLYTKAYNDTVMFSAINEFLKHPNVQQIKDYGMQAIPSLFGIMEDSPNLGVLNLIILVLKNHGVEVSPELKERGHPTQYYFDQMVKFGHQNGYTYDV